MTPEEIAAFERRLNDLGAKIEGAQSAKRAEIEARGDKALQARGMAMGLRMSSEFVAAILVGGLIGFGLDTWLGTMPWLFLVFFMIGMAAGVVNITRAFTRMQADIARQTKGDIGKPVPDDDEDE
jgi:ATP synthase protein I